METSANNKSAAIIMMLVAVAFLTVMSMLVKLVDLKYHPAQISFIRNLIATAVILPFLIRAGGTRILKTRRYGKHVIRAIIGITGNILYFYCFQRMPIGEVVIISQAVPLFVTIMAILFLGEQVGWRRWSAILVGFLGVIVAIDPTITIQPTSLVAVLATLCWASTILLMRSLGKTENPYTVAFYFMMIGSLITGLVQPWVWEPLTQDMLVLMLGAGISGALGQMLMSYSLKLAEASVVSPFSYTGILWAIGFDLVIWDVLPNIANLIGAVIITLAGIYLFRRERAFKKTPPIEPVI